MRLLQINSIIKLIRIRRLTWVYFWGQESIGLLRHNRRFIIWPYKVCATERRFKNWLLDYGLLWNYLILNCENSVLFRLPLTVLLWRNNERFFFLRNCDFSTLWSCNLKLRDIHCVAYISWALEPSVFVNYLYLVFYAFIFHQRLFNWRTVAPLQRLSCLKLVVLKNILCRRNSLFLVNRFYQTFLLYNWLILILVDGR